MSFCDNRLARAELYSIIASRRCSSQVYLLKLRGRAKKNDRSRRYSVYVCVVATKYIFCVCVHTKMYTALMRDGDAR